MFRYATVKGGSPERVAAYMPDNYRIVSAEGSTDKDAEVLIAGEDKMGWTLEDYIIPRLASGMMFVTERKEYGPYAPKGWECGTDES